VKTKTKCIALDIPRGNSVQIVGSYSLKSISQVGLVARVAGIELWPDPLQIPQEGSCDLHQGIAGSVC
jgi:hypothetical protein